MYTYCLYINRPVSAIVTNLHKAILGGGNRASMHPQLLQINILFMCAYCIFMSYQSLLIEMQLLSLAALPSACGLPLYESSGECVETCPSGQTGVGNATTLTGTCQQCEYQNCRIIFSCSLCTVATTPPFVLS